MKWPVHYHQNVMTTLTLQIIKRTTHFQIISIETILNKHCEVTIDYHYIAAFRQLHCGFIIWHSQHVVHKDTLQARVIPICQILSICRLQMIEPCPAPLSLQILHSTSLFQLHNQIHNNNHYTRTHKIEINNNNNNCLILHTQLITNFLSLRPVVFNSKSILEFETNHSYE